MAGKPPSPKKKKKAASTTRTARTAATAKKKPAAKQAPKPKPKKVQAQAKATAKAKAKVKVKAKVKAKATAKLKPKNVAEAAPTTERSPVTKPEAPPPTPSERLLAARAQAPKERPLTDDEREAMAQSSAIARKFINAGGEPPVIISQIATFLEEVRSGRREEPTSQDVKLGLGVLWGEQLRAQVGWRWVFLTYPDGFASYALVPDDRAFACFPLNRIRDALRPTHTNTSAHIFDSIRENTLPSRKSNAYLVIG